MIKLLFLMKLMEKTCNYPEHDSHVFSGFTVNCKAFELGRVLK